MYTNAGLYKKQTPSQIVTGFILCAPWDSNPEPID